MPSLYIIGLIAVTLQYISERWTLTYFYRLPPKYTESLTLATLEVFSYAPVCAAAILCWQYTNMQMFDNKIDSVDTNNELRRSHHFLSSIKWQHLENC